MTEKIQIKNIEPIKAVCISYQGKVRDAGKWMPALYRSVHGKANGAPFFCFLEMDEAAGTGVLELCLPSEMEVNTPGVQCKVFPAVRAIWAAHLGGYDSLPLTYQVIRKFIETNHLQFQLPWREVYIKGPGFFFRGNPDHYVTEILFPLLEE